MISDPYDSNNCSKMIEDQKKRNKMTKKKTVDKEIQPKITDKPAMIVIESDLTVGGTRVRVNGQLLPSLSSITFTADIDSGVEVTYSMRREIDTEKLDEDEDDTDEWGFR